MHNDREGRDSVELDELAPFMPSSSSSTAAAGAAGSTSRPDDSAAARHAALIDIELDRLGFGAYQRRIFLLCGLGYYLDLLWAQTLGLCLSVLVREVPIPAGQTGLLSACFSAGLTLGALVWGCLIDVLGRKTAFNYTTLTTTVAGITLPCFSGLPMLCVLAACLGFGVGGNIPVDATIAVEFLPSSGRGGRVTLLSIFQPLGTVSTTALAYVLIPAFSCDPELSPCVGGGGGATRDCCRRQDNMGWRFLMWTLGLISLGILVARVAVFRFQESPKFLLSKARTAEAVDVVRHIAAYNGQQCLLRDEDFATPAKPDGADSRNGGGLRVALQSLRTWRVDLVALFTSPRTRTLTLLLFAVYALDFWGFSLAGLLPYILARKGVLRHESLRETYLRYLLIYSAGVPAAIAACLLVDRPQLGRRRSLVLTGVVYAAPLFLFVLIDTPEANVVFNAVEYAGQTMFNAVLYAYTAEIYPASVRGSASGLASTLGRLVMILATAVGGAVVEKSNDAVLYMAGTGVLVAAAVCLLLPETLSTT